MKRLAIIGLTALISLNAVASGNGAGNGGSSWTCFDRNGKQLWSQSVDLFEASEGDLKLQIIRTNSIDAKTQVQNAVLNAHALSPAFATELEDFLFIYNENSASSPQTAELGLIHDLGRSIKPSKESCDHGYGTIKRTQIVNYNDRSDHADVSDPSYTGLDTETDRASIQVHEAIYKKLRLLNRDITSQDARALVGCVFASNLTEDQATRCARALNAQVFNSFMSSAPGKLLSTTLLDQVQTPYAGNTITAPNTVMIRGTANRSAKIRITASDQSCRIILKSGGKSLHALMTPYAKDAYFAEIDLAKAFGDDYESAAELIGSSLTLECGQRKNEMEPFVMVRPSILTPFSMSISRINVEIEHDGVSERYSNYYNPPVGETSVVLTTVIAQP